MARGYVAEMHFPPPTDECVGGGGVVEHVSDCHTVRNEVRNEEKKWYVGCLTGEDIA